MDEPNNITLTASDLATSTAIQQALIFSIGCHAGLSVADEYAVDVSTLDFAQVLVGKGVAYIANTGYGYGDADTIGYSERLIQLFTQALREEETVGQALQKAKLAYFNELGTRAMTAYDEKVLSVATFYGIPLLRVQWPSRVPIATGPSTENFWQLTAPTACTQRAELACRSLTFTPEYTTVEDPVGKGVYFTVAGEPAQVVPGTPLQPRSSVTITLPALAARGAVFEGGSYETLRAFDPVIAQVITDTGRLDAAELPYANPDWRPSTWELINNARTPQGEQQRFVVIPAQYQAASITDGVERRFTEMQYTLYYTNTKDTVPPTLLVQSRNDPAPSELNLTVDAQDPSGVVRVVVAYTLGDGVWQSVDLTQVDPSDHWRGVLPNQPGLEYFVQAVDGGGNVAVQDNKGAYFP